MRTDHARPVRRTVLTYASSFILCGDDILILQRGASDPDFPGLWEIPGGRVKPDETLLEACRRETLEETGLRLKAAEAVSVMEYWKNRGRTRFHCIQVNFLTWIGTRRPQIRLSNEHSRYRWVTWDSYGEDLVSKEMRASWVTATAKIRELSEFNQP
jgi:8-oxo-dGTP diphosphatase